MGYNGKPIIGLVRIRKINSPYHTNVNNSITSSSVDNLIPLAGKVTLATVGMRQVGKKKVMVRRGMG